MSKVINLTEIEALQVSTQVAADLATCRSPACTLPNSPSHFSGFLVNDTTVMSYVNNGCESRGRQLDPATLMFTGSAHCACDVCF